MLTKLVFQRSQKGSEPDQLPGQRSFYFKLFQKTIRIDNNAKLSKQNCTKVLLQTFLQAFICHRISGIFRTSGGSGRKILNRPLAWGCWVPYRFLQPNKIYNSV